MSEDAQTLKELEESFTTVLQTCVAGGMPLPYQVVVVGLNGSCEVVRIPGDGGADELMRHDEGGFLVPVNMMIIDATGEAVRVVIKREGMTWH
jgi:hypothetical protein